MADKLQVIADLDLEELEAIDPPRGYGRDLRRKIPLDINKPHTSPTRF